MEYIAGFTEVGISYGVFREDLEVYGGNKFNYPREFDDKISF
ncbi:hypothetical protein BD780_000821 [Clostridium tetanomorphum]|nr:hypothetical protein [Clostridium tetanomorphum]MBP1863498.1 hypothetical protein [Clostridium tetanomorphum]NRS83596.1 hypothetical protein [Clostridium tetanomorphum]SQC01972.1 Uncharacterised protein [Clostridium tetanomorphum]